MVSRGSIFCLAALAYSFGLSGCSSTPVSQTSGSGRCAPVITVKAGDTLGEIANRCNVSLKRLAAVNGLEAPYMIRIGQRLKLPTQHAPTTVKRGASKAVLKPPRLMTPVAGQPRWLDRAAFFPAPIASPVRAAASGKVVAVRELPFYGRMVILSHQSGYLSVYGYLLKVKVKPGQNVSQGTPLGLSGVNPETGEPGVYFELRRGKWSYPLKTLFTEK